MEFVTGFVTGLWYKNRLTLTVNGTELAITPIEGSSATAAYQFGNTTNADQFRLYYYADGTTYQGRTYDECFVWEINVPVTKDTPVQLTYSVVLTEPQTASGTYGQYDDDGSEGYDGLYTNTQATLYPVDSNGDPGMPENFTKPTVSYTVSGGGGGSADYYDVTINYYDQDGNVIREAYVSPDIREGRDWDYADRQYETITFEGVTYTFDRAEGDPITGEDIRRDQVVDLYYTADETEIEDPEVPGGDLPDQPGTDPEDPGTEIEDPEVPGGDVPETGDVSALWLALSALSGTGLAAVTFTGRRKREDEA